MDRFNTLTIRKQPKRLLAVLRQTLEAAGLSLPANADVSVVIRTTGDSLTGHPVRKVKMTVSIETPASRVSPPEVIPFMPHYSSRHRGKENRDDVVIE